MSMKVYKKELGRHWICMKCGKHVQEIVIVSLSVMPKKNRILDLEMSSYFCEECFKSIFSYNNWLRKERLGELG